MSNPLANTVVCDVGARYGLHPSWAGFDAPLRYLAFEPDPEEAERLRRSTSSSSILSYEVMEAALDKTKGRRDFYLLRHRGLSSFLKPDQTSECFRHLKPGQAEIDRVISIETDSLDNICNQLGIVPDFLKVDTEGTEQDVIEGAGDILERGVLGVRSSCNFQPCFFGQRLFSETHDYLLARNFTLLNLDYAGFGYPRLGLFRKPDPIEREDFRYGVLVAADAVWVRSPLKIYAEFPVEVAGHMILKLAYFCLLNNAPDYAVDILREHAVTNSFSKSFHPTRLYRALQLRVALFLGRWRTVPDDQWEKARILYQTIYGEELSGGSEFYPQINRMARELRDEA
jgi:FkbM family methyltransferase